MQRFMSEMTSIGISDVLFVVSNVTNAERETLRKDIKSRKWGGVLERSKYAHTYPFAIERMLY